MLNRIVGEVTNDLHYFTEDKKMKKLIYVMIATALVLSIGITSAFAATETSGSETAEVNKESVSDVTKAAPAVDEDGDGVCDNCPNGGTRPLDGTGRQNGKDDRNQGAGLPMKTATESATTAGMTGQDPLTAPQTKRQRR